MMVHGLANGAHVETKVMKSKLTSLHWIHSLRYLHLPDDVHCQASLLCLCDAQETQQVHAGLLS